MKQMLKFVRTIIMAFLAIALTGIKLFAQGVEIKAGVKPTFTIARSHYTGWEPWDYIESSGLLKKWGDKYGVTLKLTPWMDYVPSINLFVAGKADGVVITNMDTLTGPAAGGVDSTALIVGDFSNGNDGIVLRNGSSIADLKGRKNLVVQGTVSAYLNSRALESAKLSDKDITEVNTLETNIVSTFIASPPDMTVTTWNPFLMEVRNQKGAKLVFDSSKIPGEIMDLLVVRTNLPIEAKKALVGAWYDCMKVMSGQGKPTNEAIEAMAKSAGGTLAEFNAQLKTTRMFYDPKDAAAFASGPDVKKTMERVRTFCFDHGLYGSSLTSKDAIGIEFADKSVMGSKTNIKFRFDPTYMQLAAEGRL